MSYNRFGVLDFKTTMASIGGPHKIINGFKLKMTSPRLLAFKRAELNCRCVKCGVEACFFAIERQKGQKALSMPCHLNLYGVKDGEDVMFTHDHILARSRGGSERNHNNIQVMCYPCNQAKGNQDNSDFMTG